MKKALVELLFVSIEDCARRDQGEASSSRGLSSKTSTICLFHCWVQSSHRLALSCGRCSVCSLLSFGSHCYWCCYFLFPCHHWPFSSPDTNPKTASCGWLDPAWWIGAAGSRSHTRPSCAARPRRWQLQGRSAQWGHPWGKGTYCSSIFVSPVSYRDVHYCRSSEEADFWLPQGACNRTRESNLCVRYSEHDMRGQDCQLHIRSQSWSVNGRYVIDLVTFCRPWTIIASPCSSASWGFVAQSESPLLSVWLNPGRLRLHLNSLTASSLWIALNLFAYCMHFVYPYGSALLHTADCQHRRRASSPSGFRVWAPRLGSRWERQPPIRSPRWAPCYL